MTKPLEPLNGTKTHPLTDHALGVLRSLERSPSPTQTINAGVVNRLQREALAEIVDLPSPYASHKGKKIKFLQITEAGRARAAQ